VSERPDDDAAPGREEVSAFGAGRAPRGTRHRQEPLAPRSPVRQGVTAALVLFGAAVALELVAMAGVRLSHDPNANVGNVFLGLGLFLMVVGPMIAGVVSLRLPKAARGPFWSAGVLCAFMAMILWGVTCAVSGTPRIGG
jgi:hypothetical protein